MSGIKIEHKVARLYYLDGFSQSEIAKKLSISVASVSRALTRAREAGIVRISIVDEEDNFGSLESQVELKYGIRECIVTPSYDQDDINYSAMAAALEDLLPRILPSHGTLGVSWGETMKVIAENLNVPSPMEADVIPMVGAMGTVETGIYPNSIARILAEKLGGRSFLVNAPAVNDSAEITQKLYQSRSFSPVREIWERIDVGLVGCSDLGMDASMARNSIFTLQDLEEMAKAGARCAVNFAFLDEEGRQLENGISGRVLHIGPREMVNFKHVVLIASGKRKVDAIRTALKSGSITALITDADTAGQL